ncbi:MAG TPA: DUF4157 domain-containing protein, partial [Humibacillus xanthopallidus]|nr:DUF4157 domain-containing protein [Humibacillus xanthopallidus]
RAADRADDAAADRAARAVAPLELARNDDRGTTGLPDRLRTHLETSLGHDFSRVHLHDDARAHRLTGLLGAEAVTVGTDVHFAPGRRDPATPSGQRLLAHELAHVKQQATSGPRVQCKLVATGSAADFVTMVNSILAVQKEIRVSSTGEVSVASTDVAGPPTRDATELLATITAMIGDSGTTTIEFIHGTTSTRASDRNVLVGNYALSRVDLDDVAAFGFETSHSRMGDNAAVQLIHELTEQRRRQINGEAFGPAHAAGYAAQERLLGARMLRESPMTPTTPGRGEVTTTYRYPDGREVDVITTLDFTTGGIVGVRRVVRP